jgi:hypothetical protein
MSQQFFLLAGNHLFSGGPPGPHNVYFLHYAAIYTKILKCVFKMAGKDVEWSEPPGPSGRKGSPDGAYSHDNLFFLSHFS